jgi:hypothetical protein
MSKTSVYHYYKLLGRTLLLVAALVIYVVGRVSGESRPLGFLTRLPALSFAFFLLFAVEILFRFFPSSIESMGCQKQFLRNFCPTDAAPEEAERIRLGSRRTTLLVAISWLFLNAPLAVLYYTGVIDAGILLLVSLFYAVADMICILFFCPFQTWIMKNKCCGSCRIYNWDYAMMFTPIALIPNIFALSLFVLSLLLVAVWEITLWRHPERFSAATNASLRCASCTEKLCHHKRQLQSFLRKNAERLRTSERLVLLRKRAGQIFGRKGDATPEKEQEPDQP